MPIQGIEAGNELVAARRDAPTELRIYLDGCTGPDECLCRFYPDPRGGRLALPAGLGRERVKVGGIGERRRCRMRFLIGPENQWLVRVNEREEGGLVFHLPEDEAALGFVYWYEFPPRARAEIEAQIQDA